MVKNPPANAGDVGPIPGLGRSPEGGHGSPLCHSCLENPMDRGVQWATVQGVTKSQTQLKLLSKAQNPKVTHRTFLFCLSPASKLCVSK